jgi:hypothetical protein
MDMARKRKLDHADVIPRGPADRAVTVPIRPAVNFARRTDAWRGYSPTYGAVGIVCSTCGKVRPRGGPGWAYRRIHRPWAAPTVEVRCPGCSP